MALLRLFILFWFISLPLRAEVGSYYLDQPLKGQYLGQYMLICSYLGPLRFEDFEGTAASQNCRPGGQEIPNMLFGKGNFWVRMLFNNPRPEPVTIVLEHTWPSDSVRFILRNQG